MTKVAAIEEMYMIYQATTLRLTYHGKSLKQLSGLFVGESPLVECSWRLS